MDEHIARANIDHFQRLLGTEKDEAKRQTLLGLLAAEEVKLKAALEAKGKKS
jgi:hypothetical protein